MLERYVSCSIGVNRFWLIGFVGFSVLHRGKIVFGWFGWSPSNQVEAVEKAIEMIYRVSTENVWIQKRPTEIEKRQKYQLKPIAVETVDS